MANVTDEQSPDNDSPNPGKGPRPERVPESAPSYLAFAVTSTAVLLADIGSKVWAVLSLDPAVSQQQTLVVIKNSLSFVLAYNRGGAWGLFHGAADHFRKPFFVVVSLVAIAFIVSLYRKVRPDQWALRWGLPLVLGGALGNLADRVTRIGVVDFIDYRANWVLAMNRLISKFVQDWTVTDHWPTFNVADIAICVGVVLMALDVLFANKHQHPTGHGGSSEKALKTATADPGSLG